MQHSDAEVQEKYLELMRVAAMKGKASQWVALLDRVAVNCRSALATVNVT